MLAALRTGQLGGVGIDTFEHETEDLLALAEHGRFTDPQWQALLAMPNVILSPHIAYYTETAVRNMCDTAMQALHDLAEQQTSDCEVYPAAGMRKAQ
ncbi:NAD(P)-dependent oxidoreductase [Lacticaseibacillus camelliae]|nr:NAD(P)-dependent oxidoreductase [Lacticaseibacillus camelliae]